MVYDSKQSRRLQGDLLRPGLHPSRVSEFWCAVRFTQDRGGGCKLGFQAEKRQILQGGLAPFIAVIVLPCTTPSLSPGEGLMGHN